MSARVGSHEVWAAFCLACGWDGDDRLDDSDAYADMQRHNEDHHGGAS